MLQIGEENLTENEENESQSTRSNSAQSKTTAGVSKRQKINISSELFEAKQQMAEAFEHVKGSSANDEYEFFGKLIAAKIRKLKDPYTRDIIMGQIHNIVIRACTSDRVQQNSQQFSPSTSSISTYQSPSPVGPSSYHSPVYVDQTFSTENYQIDSPENYQIDTPEQIQPQHVKASEIIISESGAITFVKK